MSSRLPPLRRIVRPIMVLCCSLIVAVAAELPEQAQGQTPQQVAIAEAVRDGNHPERLNGLMTPPPFDREAYERDKAWWLAEHVPSRIWLVAQPGPDVTALAAVGDEFATTPPGGSVELAVRAEPGAPVSWSSWQGGIWASSRTSFASVEADADGIARVTWIATEGTIGDAHVSASSPYHSSMVEFFIQVEDAESPSPAGEEAP